MMRSNFIVYTVGALILGIVFASITSYILQFVPYFTAGLIVTLPIYGVLRERTGGRSFGSIFSVIRLATRHSIGLYIVLFVVVVMLHNQIGDALYETVTMSLEGIALSALTWELIRFSVKKKYTMPSYIDAVMGAF